jgi:VIT1/CCC1 family predicted Fe2+/Mn2+ transporter
LLERLQRKGVSDVVGTSNAEPEDQLGDTEDEGLTPAREMPVADAMRRAYVVVCGALAAMMAVAATVLLTLYLTRDTLRYLPSRAANDTFMIIAGTVLVISTVGVIAAIMSLADGLSVWQRIGRSAGLAVFFAALLGLQAWYFEYLESVWWLLIFGSLVGFPALCVRACRPARG